MSLTYFPVQCARMWISQKALVCGSHSITVTMTLRAAVLQELGKSTFRNNKPKYSSSKMSTGKPTVWVWKSHPTPNPCLDFPDFLVDLVREHFDIIWYGDVKADPELGKKAQAVFMTNINGKQFLEQKHLLPNIKIVANVGVGYDHIPVDDLSKQGVVVTNTPGILSGTVADQAMALLLSSAREIVPSVQWVRQNATLHVNLLGVEVEGATLGIVGLGSVGFKIAQRALGFSMKILYHQRSRKTKEAEDSLGGAEFYSRLQDMLPHCDFVVLACPLTTATENMFGAKEFSLMKPTAILVNVARGPIVNHDAMVVALKTKQIHGAALDVTDPEPLPPKHPLLEMENVIITPHAGTATYGTRRTMFQNCLSNLKAVLIDNTTPPNVVKPSSTK